MDSPIVIPPFRLKKKIFTPNKRFQRVTNILNRVGKREKAPGRVN